MTRGAPQPGPAKARFVRGPDGKFVGSRPANPDAPRRPKRPYKKSGFYSLKAKVKARGLQAIDRRSPAAKYLLAWREQLVADLGGAADLTAARSALVEDAVRSKLILDHADAWLLEQRTLITRQRRLRQLVMDRMKVAEHLAKLLDKLGLDRRAKPVQDLEGYLRDTYPGDGGAPADSAPDPG